MIIISLWSRNALRQAVPILTVLGLLTGWIPDVYASDPFGPAFCNYADMFDYVSAGLKVLATLILGLYLLINRGTWSQVMLHIAASALLFGSAEIVEALAPTSTATCP